MLPVRVSNPGPLTYESGALPIALRGPADLRVNDFLREILKAVALCNGKDEETVTCVHHGSDCTRSNPVTSSVPQEPR